MLSRTFPNWIETYLRMTDNSEASYLYRKWCAISGIASCLQRKCHLRWHRYLFPNMYIVLIGPPGGGKGTAMDPLRDMLMDLGVRICAQATTPEALVRRLKEASASIETESLTKTHNSMTVHAGELAVFIPKGHDQFLSWLTDLYDCTTPWEYDTKHQGRDYIEGVCLNMIGGTTPSLLRMILPVDSGVGGGLASRMVFISAKGKEKPVPFPFLNITQSLPLYEGLKTDLEQILMLSGGFKFDQSFLTEWEPFYMRTFNCSTFDHQHFEGYDNRRITHVLKLCMIMSASRTNSLLITGEDLLTAIATLEEAEKTMVSAFDGYGKSDIAALLPSIMRTIAAHRKMSFGQLLGKYIKDVNSTALKDVVTSLQATNYCTIDYEKGNMMIVYKENT